MSGWNKGIKQNYTLKQPNKNGIYIFVIEGEIQIDDEVLSSRDGIGI